MNTLKRTYNDIRKFKEYIQYAVGADLKAGLANTMLGYIWWILDPLFNMLIYYFLFEIIFNRNEPFFPLFLFCVLLPWKWITTSWQGSAGVIQGKAGIIKQVYIPKTMLPLQLMLSNFVTMLIGYVVILGMLIAYRLPITWHLIELIPIWGVTFLLTYGVSLIFAHLGVIFTDFRNMLGHLIRLLFYLSPSMYGIDRVMKSSFPEWLKDLYYWLNPFASLFTSYRNVILGEKVVGVSGNPYISGPISPDYILLAFWAIISIFIIWVGAKILYTQEKNYTKII